MSFKFGLLCLASVICLCSMVNAAPEPPRFRPQSQRFRQFARQEAPYPPASAGNPATVYGPPPTTAAPPKPSYGPPPPSYGPPPAVAGGDGSETVDPSVGSEPSAENPEAESVASGQFRAERLRLANQQKLQPLEQGSYFIQLPNGSIQRVTYQSAADPVDNSVSAKLQFQPVVSLAPQAPALQPVVFNPYVTAFNV